MPVDPAVLAYIGGGPESAVFAECVLEVRGYFEAERWLAFIVLDDGEGFLACSTLQVGWANVIVSVTSSSIVALSLSCASSSVRCLSMTIALIGSARVISPRHR